MEKKMERERKDIEKTEKEACLIAQDAIRSVTITKHAPSLGFSELSPR